MTTYSGKKRTGSIAPAQAQLLKRLADSDGITIDITPYDDHVLLTATSANVDVTLYDDHVLLTATSANVDVTLRQTTINGQAAWLLTSEDLAIDLHAANSSEAIGNALALIGKGFDQ